MSGNLVPFPSPKKCLVIDTSPVMEWLKDRNPAADPLDVCIDAATAGETSLFMSRINLGEVFYTSAREWGFTRAEQALHRVQEFPITFVSVSDDEVLSAARLKAGYRVSYADAFVADLAIQYHCPLLTGDADFRPLEAAGILQLHGAGA